MAKRVLYPLIAIGVILLVSLTGLNAQQSSGETISISSDDIGGVVAFLCSEEGRWVNSQRLEASGGMFL